MGINESSPHVTTGHRQVCINCGRSVLRARSHVLRTDTEREKMIRTVIREWIIPRSVSIVFVCLFIIFPSKLKEEVR